MKQGWTLAVAWCNPGRWHSKRADSRRSWKDRVTLNVCASALATIKLPLHLIQKSQWPRCFRVLPVKLFQLKYFGQTNAWMTCKFFHNLFHSEFVPTVHQKLKPLRGKTQSWLTCRQLLCPPRWARVGQWWWCHLSQVFCHQMLHPLSSQWIKVSLRHS